MPSDPKTEALWQRIDALVKDADATESQGYRCTSSCAGRPPASRGGTGRRRRPREEGSRRQGAATIFFLVLDYV
jgi:hypothetical protein